MDKLDKELIKELIQDSSKSNREIGEKLYISSQAISQRKERLKTLGIINKYSVVLNLDSIYYIEIYLNGNDFLEFEDFVKSKDSILSIEKIEGGFCYLIKYLDDENNTYKNFLEEVEQYARYKVSKVSKIIK